jgi:hypothetical protein
VTPDGAIVFFDYDTGEWFRIDPSGRDKTMLMRGNSSARITPDGKELTYIDASSGAPVVHIRGIEADSPVRDIPADAARLGGLAIISPDRRRLAYGSFDEQKRPAVTVCDLPACASKRTFPLNVFRWTPDSEGLAFAEQNDIWIQPVGGGPARQFTHFPMDGKQIWGLAWSTDGRRLAVGRASITNNIVLLRGLNRPAR